MTLPPQLKDALIAVDGRIATLTLNRDDVRNELTGTGLVDDIVRTAEWINSDESISVLILTGSGQAFSAGGNVKHMLQREGTFGGTVYAVQQQYRAGIQRVALALHKLEVPSIAAVNGAAIGAGFDLACLCDLRIAAAGARMGETFGFATAAWNAGTTTGKIIERVAPLLGLPPRFDPPVAPFPVMARMGAWGTR